MIVRRRTVAAWRSSARLEWSKYRCALEHFIAGHDVLGGELAQATNRHQLDEANMPRMIEREPCEIDDLVIVDSAHHDHVQLDRSDARRLGRACGSDRFESEVSASNRSDTLGAQTVSADVDAIQSGAAQWRRKLGQSHAIRRERDVLDLGDRAQHLDQTRQRWANRWLAPRYAQAAQPERRELRDDARDLFVAENIRLRQPRETFDRHAIQAAEVAPIRDRDPEIFDAPAKLVAQRLFHRSSHASTSSVRVLVARTH